MKRILKRIENAKSAPIQIQNAFSVVNRPLSLRRAIPTVGSVGLPVGCARKTHVINLIQMIIDQNLKYVFLYIQNLNEMMRFQCR